MQSSIESSDRETGEESRSSTTIEIDGRDWLIDGRPTYEGRSHRGRRIDGLLLNSRMVQAVFDDACEKTRGEWAYPDTSACDPGRNTDAFCAMLPTYRAHGPLAVTVGMQGGGAIYCPAVFHRYLNSAFRPDGSLEPAYLDRLSRILRAADDADMAVCVNYFYRMQQRFDDDAAVRRATEEMTAWLLASGHRNILVDLQERDPAKARHPVVAAHPRAARRGALDHGGRPPAPGQHLDPPGQAQAQRALARVL